jgi:hypothetical protein
VFFLALAAIGKQVSPTQYFFGSDCRYDSCFFAIIPGPAVAISIFGIIIVLILLNSIPST